MRQKTASGIKYIYVCIASGCTMADPLGIAARVVAVLQLAAAATQYLKDVKNGAADRIRLRDELRSTVCLVEMLQDRLEDADDFSDGESVLMPQAVSSLSGPLHLFRQVLEEMNAQLAPQDGLRRLAQPVTWPLDKKKVTELLACLERLKSHFNIVLQNNIAYGSRFSFLRDRISTMLITYQRLGEAGECQA